MKNLLTVENIIKLVIGALTIGAMYARLEGMESRVNIKIDNAEQRTADRIDFLKWRMERMEKNFEHTTGR